MKILGIIAAVLSVVGVLIGVYNHFEVVPLWESIFNISDRSDMEMSLLSDLSDKKFLFGSLALFLGPIGVLLGLIAGLKKIKIGWLAVVLGAVTFVLGALQSTHMFS